jgi:hypothetical protein
MSVLLTEDDEYAYMQAVFMPIDRYKPNLPFSEFITDSGAHMIVRGSAKYQHHYHARYSIPSPRGTMDVSVISGRLFYCTPDAPYEVSINQDEPRGRVTDEELMILLAKIISGGDYGIQE